MNNNDTGGDILSKRGSQIVESADGQGQQDAANSNTGTGGGEIEHILQEQQSVDIKSLLSIIANSASVEVWIIDQDVLGLLPFDVQAKLVNRLKAE